MLHHIKGQVATMRKDLINTKGWTIGGRDDAWDLGPAATVDEKPRGQVRGPRVEAPPEGVEAPPEGVEAPPEGVEAPPEGVGRPKGDARPPRSGASTPFRRIRFAASSAGDGRMLRCLRDSSAFCDCPRDGACLGGLAV